MTTMPDPWGPPSIVSLDMHEVPIREVLSRLDGLTDQLSEYAAFAIHQGYASTEGAGVLRAVEVLAGAALDALNAWDCWLTAEPMGPMGPLVPADLASRVRHVQLKTTMGAERLPGPNSARPQASTPDQLEAAARHLRLQRGEPS